MSKMKWLVEIIESEAGWGSRVDETKEFDNEVDALEFSDSYNKKYNPPLKPGERVPGWYMYASEPYVVIERSK